MVKVGIVGCGLIGRAWAISFARGGHEVAIWDQDRKAAAGARERIFHVLEDLAEQDLLHGQSGAEILKRIAVADELAAALADVHYVQESTPEDVAIKREVFSRLEASAPAEAILASSTSALLPSTFTDHLSHRSRCLVVHPINPPHLIPAAEVVPAPWTSDETVEQTRALLTSIGQAPLVMKQELDGFIMNRLQGALLEEAFRLVAGGYATIADVDTGIRDGLALRWSFMGPFETIDLNAPGGISDYVQRYQSMYRTMFDQMTHRVDWAGEVMAEVERDRRKALAAQSLGERQSWRDRRLMALISHKKASDERFGK